jgi:hypothetical protein
MAHCRTKQLVLSGFRHSTSCAKYQYNYRGEFG